ncbi:hypothetical protein SP15_293 [Bacillus phage SP-15]|uniref:S-layer protein SbsC C-terminal domain-containing protein n=1 Tax=Bacillus phage SP-15 TaxID=1792032 RepID=A0A127AZ78_9CAUD|nr:hypothetical protein SP15_293 [Bacillus phage SP-15]AMM45101.1 hypothetical protein SP15_293 [Bacillus phage SP-15]
MANRIVEWMVVFEDPETNESTHENVWAFSQQEARDEFLELMPEVTRVIGVYVAVPVGCSKEYAGEAGPEPASGLTVSAKDDQENTTNTLITVEEDLLDASNKFVWNSAGATVPTRPIIGSTVSWSALPDRGSVPAMDGDYIEVAEVDTNGKIVSYGYTQAVVA